MGRCHPVSMWMGGIAFLLAMSVSVRAESDFVGLIPNGSVNDCLTCHLDGTYEEPEDPGFRRDFDRNRQRWSRALAMLDSDGDGYTNGEELGDVNGTWTEGAPDPGDWLRVSNPSDPDSTPIPPDLPVPTPDPEDPVIALYTNEKEYEPGDTMAVSVTLSHYGSSQADVVAYIAIELGGTFWFWPGFTAYAEGIPLALEPGFSMDPVTILEFAFPGKGHDDDDDSRAAPRDDDDEEEEEEETWDGVWYGALFDKRDGRLRGPLASAFFVFEGDD